MLRRLMMAGAGSAPGGDPHWSNVVSLLRFNGANGSAGTADDAGAVWTNPTPSTTRVSSTDAKYGAGCLEVSSGLLSCADSTRGNFGSGDFTIEFWMRPATASFNSSPVSQWSGSGNRGWVIYTLGSGLWFSYSTNGSAQVNVEATVTYSASSYQHIAVSCVAGVIRIFFNGVMVGSANRAGPLYASTLPVTVGRMSDVIYQFIGRLDDVRITKGVGRYVSDFTPPGELPAG